MFNILKWWRARSSKSRNWRRRTLVVGPIEPVDGDSVSCTKALIVYLRKRGRQAYTLPTVAMYPQIQWVLEPADLHPACRELASERLTTPDLQAAYDAILKPWRPDEIVIVDGQPDRLGFDPRAVPVYTIDHHIGKTGPRDDDGGCIQSGPSCGCVLIQRFRIYEPILVVSILTDTFWLRQNEPAQAIDALGELRKHCLTDQKLEEIQRKLMVPKDPDTIKALREAEYYQDDDAVFMVLKDKRPEIHRGVMADLGYYFRYICVVRGDGYVSFRTTDRKTSLRELAARWQGGGHDAMAAGRVNPEDSAAIYKLRQEFISFLGQEPSGR